MGGLVLINAATTLLSTETIRPKFTQSAESKMHDIQKHPHH